MIANSLLIPTEKPVTENEIKRALLTYDKVYIPSPDDRELIPPNTYQNVVFKSLGFPAFPFSHGGGPVKPLGKVDNFDDNFQLVLDKCKKALSQDSIKILNPPKYDQSFTIGAIPVPDDTPNVLFTYLNYRRLSEQEDFVNSVYSGIKDLDLDSVADISELIPAGSEDKNQIVNDVSRPEKKKLNIKKLDEDKINLLSGMCHARLGTLVKYIGYSFIKKLHPFTTDFGYANVLSRLEKNFIDTVNEIEEESEFIARQKKLNVLQNIIFNEYIDPKVIDSLSVDQVLKLRSKAWGKAHSNRKKLFQELNVIARDDITVEEFENICRNKFEEYLNIASDYQHEVDKLKIKLMMDASIFFYLTAC
jgi:hypothetical protein